MLEAPAIEAVAAVMAAVMTGVCAGMITGITPGLHINLVSSVLIALFPIIGGKFGFSPLMAFLIAMSISHTFFDAIPSTLLGAPDPSAVLSVLPSHRMVMKGRAIDAIVINLCGSIAAIVTFILLLPILPSALPILTNTPKSVILILVTVIPLGLLISKNTKKTAINATAFLLSGMLGLITFQYSMLMPLLSGMFGIPTLFNIINNNAGFPEQKKKISVRIGKKTIAKRTCASALASLVSSLVPGITTAHSAWLSSLGRISARGYIFSAGFLNTADMCIALLALAVVGVQRNGTSIAIAQIALASGINVQDIGMSMAGIIAIAGAICIIPLLIISRISISAMERLNYRMISLVIIIFVTALVVLFNGVLGMVVFAASAALGICATECGARRSSMTGVLIFPLIVHYLHAIFGLF